MGFSDQLVQMTHKEEKRPETDIDDDPNKNWVYCICGEPHTKYKTQTEKYKSEVVMCEKGNSCITRLERLKKDPLKDGGHWWHFHCAKYKYQNSWFCIYCDPSKSTRSIIVKYLENDGYKIIKIPQKYKERNIYVSLCRYEIKIYSDVKMKFIREEIFKKFENLCRSDYQPDSKEKHAYNAVQSLLNQYDNIKIHISNDKSILDLIFEKNIYDFNKLVI